MKLLAIFLLFLLIAAILAVKLHDDCEYRGGKLMKNIYGGYVCTKAIEVEE